MDSEDLSANLFISCGGQCVNVINGRHGRDGTNGKDGLMGPRGLQGPPGDSFPLQQGIGLFNTTTYSFITETGIAGIRYNDNSEILNIINRKLLPITYIGIVWSTIDTSTEVVINLTDVSNKIVWPLIIGPSKLNSVKNIYEIFPSPSITTQFTRLLKFCLTVTPKESSVSFFSIMVGFN